MTEERPKELCCECEAETGRAGKSEDSLYIEMQKGDRGPLCQACYTKWRAIASRIYIRFDGPPAHESGRFIEVERDGTSIRFGEWIQDGNDCLLVFPDAEDQVDRCIKDIIDWCKRSMPHFQKGPEFAVAKAFDDELHEICRRYIGGADNPTGLEGDLHQILDVLDIGRVRKGRVIIRQRVREGIEELEAEVDRLTTVLESIAADEQQGIIVPAKASQAIAPGAGRRRRIKS